MSVRETVEKIKNGEITAEKLVQSSLEKIEETRAMNAYISVYGESALEESRRIDKKRSRGE